MEKNQSPSDNELIVSSPGCRIDESTGPKITESRPFPVEELPPQARDFVLDASRSIGCDTSFIALQFWLVCLLLSATVAGWRLQATGLCHPYCGLCVSVKVVPSNHQLRRWL